MRAAVGLTDGLGLDGDRCIRVIPRHIPLQIFPYIYFPQIFTQTGCMIENVKIPIDHNTILVF